MFFLVSPTFSLGNCRAWRDFFAFSARMPGRRPRAALFSGVRRPCFRQEGRAVSRLVGSLRCVASMEQTWRQTGFLACNGSLEGLAGPTCAPPEANLCPQGGASLPGREGRCACLGGESKSVIRVQNDFALPPCRLAVAFVPGVARYAGTKRQRRCRWQDERAWKAGERLSGTRQGGLMTDLG